MDRPSSTVPQRFLLLPILPTTTTPGVITYVHDLNGPLRSGSSSPTPVVSDAYFVPPSPSGTSYTFEVTAVLSPA